MGQHERHAEDSLNISDEAAVLVGTWAVVPLIEAAQLARDAAAESANRVERADPADGSGRANSLADENRQTLVAILCAHAAIEAFTNQEGSVRDQARWEADEAAKKQLVDKWCGLVERLSGAVPSQGQGAAQKLKMLDDERNSIAHYKGFKLPGGTRAFASAPTSTPDLGNISGFRAYYRAGKANTAVATAWAVIESFYVAINDPLPEYLAITRR